MNSLIGKKIRLNIPSWKDFYFIPKEFNHNQTRYIGRMYKISTKENWKDDFTVDWYTHEYKWILVKSNKSHLPDFL